MELQADFLPLLDEADGAGGREQFRLKLAVSGRQDGERGAGRHRLACCERQGSDLASHGRDHEHRVAAFRIGGALSIFASAEAESAFAASTSIGIDASRAFPSAISR